MVVKVVKGCVVVVGPGGVPGIVIILVKIAVEIESVVAGTGYGRVRPALARQRLAAITWSNGRPG